MLKHAKRLLAATSAATSAVAVAGLVTVGGLTAASASPAARPSVSGIEHFQLVSASAAANKAPVIAYGLFAAPAVDHMGNTTDTFKFRGGSFRVKHSPGHGNPSFNARTCVLQGTIRGTYSISHGTGRYAGISGHGTYVLRLLSIARRNAHGQCNTNQNALPLAFQDIIDAHGPVRL